MSDLYTDPSQLPDPTGDTSGGGLDLSSLFPAQPSTAPARPGMAPPTPPGKVQTSKMEMVLGALLPLIMRQHGPMGAAALLQGIQQAQARDQQQRQVGYENQRQAYGDQRQQQSMDANEAYRQQTLQAQHQQRIDGLMKEAATALQNAETPEGAQQIQAFYTQRLQALGAGTGTAGNPADALNGLAPSPSRLEQKAAQKYIGQLEKTYGQDWATKVSSATFVLPGAPVDPTTGTPRPIGVQELLAKSGLNMQGVPTKPETPKQLSPEKMLVDGRLADVLVDHAPTATQRVFGLDNQPIAASRVKAYEGRPPASLLLNQAGQGDIETQAQMLFDGDIVPSMMSKRSASFNATIARANKLSLAQTGKPLNLTKIQTDYAAAQRFAASMNSSQMVRFKGLAGSVVNTIDEVNRLADELKQGGVQLYNRAKRGSILQVYGNTPQSQAAAEYLGAVNTLKEEFASLVQGGYAPTESAFALANQQVNADFGVKDLTASLGEVRRLINFRVGAFNDLTPTLTGGGPAAPASGVTPQNNPYARR